MNISDGGRRRFEDNEHTLRIYPGTISEGTIYCPVPARKSTTAAEVIDTLINKLHLDKTKCYVLAEVKEFGGEEWILNPTDCPVQRMMLWPRMALENRLSGEDYRFLLREKNLDGSIHYGSLQSWLQVTEERRRMMERGFLPQPQQKDFDDLCSLPDLSEKTLLENLRNRFKHEKIYTYVGSILIVINPFKFLPIYNPKYVKMYDNHQLGKLEPHIYAVADVAYHAMLQRKKNQCIVISGESGSGKTQSTNFLIHHLTALSQKGFASGVEQIILGAGPVLEAFGNAKTAHNNNSSRFGKFIQVNYQETGTVLGNYHVFYYLLAGASEEERLAFHLKQPEEYHYLNQDCFTVEGEDLRHDFERLQLAMEMVGFLPKTRRQIFSLLSAILHLGNICYKKKTYRDDSIDICNPEVLPVVSELLEVKEEMLFEALVTRKTVTVGEKLILPYKLAEAVTVRNSMAKSLYSALFDWIVFRINHALLNSKDLERNTKTLSIGVLDIFGFEDYENNSFEQFCINFANERLQHYFNQHIFKLEQEEYRTEGISWHNIDYIDNTCCINLISKKPTGLLHLLDEESNFPQATNQTLLDKFKHQHEENSYIEFPAVMEPAFIIKHYAGKVKYGVKDFREKNTDHMRPDIVALLRSSKNAFISGMIGIDPVAVFRWAVLRAFFRAMVAFREAGKRHIQRKSDITRKNPRTPLSDLQGMNTLNEKNQQRNKNFKSKPALPKHLLEVNSLKHLTRLTLQDRITKSLLHLHKKKKPPSISAQFQASLSKLMETLGQAEPYFVKCIRSNAEKLPLRFNDALVLRQLRYTGMLETVRIRQSGYSSKYSFQDFVSHFHVLLPRNTIPSKLNIQDFVRKINLNPDNYQVGKTMVFLKEQGRQHLQDLLHQEVLRRIILLQRWFRVLLCRQHFLHLKQSSIIIQQFWRNYLNQKQVRDVAVRKDAFVMARAATLLQASWRAHLERQRYLELRAAVLIIQQKWREIYRRRHMAATCIQARWKGYRESKRYQEQKKKIILLQSTCRGFRARQRFKALKEQRIKEAQLELGMVNIKAYRALEIEGSDPSEWEDCSFDNREKAIEEGKSGIESNRISRESSVDCSKESPEKWQERARSQSGVDLKEDVIVRERPKSLEDLHQKKVVRAKRESRRMRELEQAIFSLELLKVRSLGGMSPSEERRWSTELMPEGLQSPQGTPDSESSQGSLELLNCEESQKSKLASIILDEGDLKFPSPKTSSSPKFDSQDNAFSASSETNYALIQKGASSDSECLKNGTVKEKPVCSSEPITCKPQLRDSFLSNSLPTFFYIPHQDPLKASSQVDTSIQRKKLSESEDTLGAALSLDINRDARKYHFSEDKVVPSFNTDSSNTVLKKLEKLNTEKEERQKQLQQQNEKQMMEQIHQQTDILEKEHKVFKKIEKPRTGESFLAPSFCPPKQRIERPSSLFILNTPNKEEPSVLESPSLATIKDTALAPKDSPFAQLPVRDRPVTLFFERKGNPCQSNTVRELSKTERMGTQQSITHKLSNNRISKREHLRPFQSYSHKSDDPSREGSTKAIFFTPKDNMSTPLPQKAKMRFWTKGKQGEKKTTRVKPATQSEVSAFFAGSDVIPSHQFPDELAHYNPTPPLSPELPGSCRKEFKENKEPSPKAKRKRSVKISNVAFESVHWQNDSIQIITSTGDLKSMDEFLLKKMHDLDNEDSKKDTLVDVVFKKALKEFRQNIFSFYSSALAMDDGKSIRYKDLYALFEQILEKTMRLEQRDWSESPVRVWVNTFKVFLDEYMNDFKTSDSTATKVPKTERKKRRKKETDLYDPELSSRQFGVELSRLTSEDRSVPLVVEKLINYIEMHGLYTEGIYRKSGSTNKIKELRQGLDTDAESVNLDDYNIHVIASVFKQWLRDLPNPLMTFELYEEFLRAMGLQERKETIRGVYSVIDQLSRTHLNTLERLIFHLVRIALQEDTNRMSANALAIVFAPCILRCPDTTDPLQSVQDISKTTTCVELIVVEQMNKYKARLKDISSLEFAENKAKTRLSLIRRSMGKGRVRRGNYPSPSSPVTVRLPSMSDVPEETLTNEATTETDITEQQQVAMQQEERILTEQIENLQKEKEELTFEMLVLEPRASDDETLESEASIGTADSSENLNMESEGTTSERSERSLALSSLKAAGKSEPSSKLRKQLKKQQDSLDSVDSSISSCLSNTALSHGTRKRFQIYSKSPFFRAASAGEALGMEGPLGQTKSLEERPQFISRGTFNPEKGKQKLKNVKNSPQKTKETPEGTVMSGHRKPVDPDCNSTQQLALFGSNEFMV
ncbi:Unconventional myosin-IXa [Sciurus carolinensis]|uniref:Unconventional myosin-IXa n=1 Tax=Sciurus carolinensis TaxID=30640 RepID=A0AA41N4A0_SCICA|nr:Unconventional myosin-IXa [Sciurus carolinensis]